MGFFGCVEMMAQNKRVKSSCRNFSQFSSNITLSSIFISPCSLCARGFHTIEFFVAFLLSPSTEALIKDKKLVNL
jgi:hypothetical protein